MGLCTSIDTKQQLLLKLRITSTKSYRSFNDFTLLFPPYSLLSFPIFL